MVQSYPEKSDDIESIVHTLIQRYNIERIYLNRYDGASFPYELIILVANKYVKTLGELVPKIVNTIRDFSQYRVMCYVAFQAKDKIRQGNLFLFTSCHPNKLIYQKEASTFAPIPSNFDARKCLDLAASLRCRELQKIDEFRDGYYHFKNKGKYALASFMLHQTIELTYRYLEQLLTAKEKITHSIRCHHCYLLETSSMYTAIFDDDQDTDIHLLQILEGIYRATRYEDHFQIDLTTLLLLETKMEALLANSVDISERILLLFEQEYVL